MVVGWVEVVVGLIELVVVAGVETIQNSASSL